jgi:chromate reductase
LIVTPEYNNSIPGILKNAIDWLSRPPDDIPRVFRGRPVAIMGATPGSGATALSQAAWLPVLRFLGMRPWFEQAVLISDASSVFDRDGRLTGAPMRQRVRSFVEGFAAFAAAQRDHDSQHASLPYALQPNLRRQTLATIDAGDRRRAGFEGKEAR